MKWKKPEPKPKPTTRKSEFDKRNKDRFSSGKKGK